MLGLVPLQPVDYLVIGHITQDITPAGLQLGGTVAFSALTARALGLRVGIVTAVEPDLALDVFNGITVVNIPSEHTTTFENIYNKGGRVQVLHRQAAHIPYESVPDIWLSTSILHLGPVAQELDTQLPESFKPGMLGITPQGWMRIWDIQGHVTPCAWQTAEMILPQAAAVTISREDVSGDEEVIENMAHLTRVLAVTEAAAGAVLSWNGDRRRFPAPKMKVVDSTGAGDIFAAAFFIRLFTTRDPWEAGRFAIQIASRSVTRPGLNGIPTLKEVNECLMEVI